MIQAKRFAEGWCMDLPYALRLLSILLLMFPALAAQADSYPLSSTVLAERIANKQQLTDVPTIYIDIPGITNETELNDQLKKVRNSNPDVGDTAPYFDATITVVDNSAVGSTQHLESFTDEVKIKVRGNSTSDHSKRPYRLKFPSKTTSSDGLSHKHDLLGLGYSKRNWTLLANAFDKSMLRNAVTYHLGKYVGMTFCPGYKFVDLVISGMYRGTYQVSDHVEVGKNRVNINETTDWLMEFTDWANMAETPYVPAENGCSYTSIKNPDADDLTEAQVTQLIADVKEWRTNWFNSLKSSNSSTGWQAYNDVESFINFVTATEITGDYDGYFVFKGYRTPDGPFFWGPLWDKDLAYSNCSYAPDYANGEHKMVAYYGKSGLEWIFRNDNGSYCLFSDKTFLQKFKAKIDLLIENDVEEKLCTDIDNILASIKGSVAQNYSRWDLNTSAGLETHVDYTYDQNIAHLKGYIRSRLTFLQGELQKYIDALPAPTEGTYDPTKYSWDPGLSTGSSYNLSITNRTLTGGKWNTFCLPFDATQEQMEASMGCTYELLVHTSVDADGTMVFTTPSSKKISAGVPYLIKPSSNVNSFGKLEDVTISYDTQWGSLNGNEVTFDNVHYFTANIYCQYGWKFAQMTGKAYVFTNELYEADSSLQLIGSTDKTGCSTFIRTSDGSTPAIRIDESTSGGEDDPTVRTQLTDLPTIYIDTENGASIEPSSGAWKQAAIEVVDANGTLTPFTEESSYMRIRGRGTTTWNATSKKSYRIQFTKDVVDGLGLVQESHTHNLLGLDTSGGKQRNWVLMANAGDKSLVRNALTKHLGDGVGLDFTPGYCFVDLVINDTYVGTYQVTDYIEPGTSRVNIDEDSGWLMEMMTSDKVDDSDYVIEGDANTPYITVKNPDIEDESQQTAFNTTFKAFFDPMWEATDGTGMDNTSLVNWYIASEILGNYEALADIFAYKEADGTTLHFGPLWNNELSFDNCEQQEMSSTGLMSDLGNAESFNGLIFNSNRNSSWKAKLATLWEQEWFSSLVVNRWNELYNDGNNDLLSSLLTTLGTLETKVAQSQAKNYASTSEGGAGWSLSSQGLTGFSSTRTFSSYAESVEQVRTYLEERFAYLDNKFNALSAGETYLLGDVDHNGGINVTDVVNMVSYILGMPIVPFYEENADVNGDGIISTADLTSVISIILGTDK